jgi:hypothetical protein
MATFTTNKGYSLPTVGGDIGSWGGENNASFTILDNNMGGITTVNCAGNSNVTATTTQSQALIQNLTGVLTGNIQYIMPALGGFWFIENNTTGAFNVTVISAATGASVLVNQGSRVLVYCDGTNFYETDFTLIPGISSISVAGSANVTAAPVQLAYQVIQLTGAITGNIKYILPNAFGQWIIFNSTTGAFTVTISAVGAGTGVVIPQGNNIAVVSDGTNVYSTTTINAGTFSNLSVSGTLGVGGATSLASLSATGAVTGAGFVALMASPGPIGSTAAGSGAFTTLATSGTYTASGALTANGTVSGTGITSLFASPPAIGSTATNSGAFTTLAASGAVTGTGFLNLFATTPAIGGTAPNSGAFTTLSTNNTVSMTGGSVTVNNAAGGFIVAGSSLTTLSGSVIMGGTNVNPIGNQVAGGTFSANGNYQSFTNNATACMSLAGGSSGNLMEFYNSVSASVGSISTNGTGIFFNTLSDGRLKVKRHKLAVGIDVGHIIDRLKPWWFNWKTDPDADPEPGFIAQEVHKWFPWAVTKPQRGPKTIGKCSMWRMDNSKLIPLLVAEIQDLRRRVAALEK